MAEKRRYMTLIMGLGGILPPFVTVEDAGEKRGQDPDLATAAVFHGDIIGSISQQLSRPAGPTNSFAIGELWRGQLNLLLSDVSIQGSAGRMSQVRLS